MRDPSGDFSLGFFRARGGTVAYISVPDRVSFDLLGCRLQMNETACFLSERIEDDYESL